MEMISQPKIYFPVSGEKGGLCFNHMNTPKLNHILKMPIQTTGVTYPVYVSSFYD